jgi:pimeloyl-ACP methyl ester carboxylesterase
MEDRSPTPGNTWEHPREAGLLWEHTAGIPPVRYVRNGSVNIAYQMVGGGPVDVLMIPGWTSHLLIEWEEPTFVRFMERLTSFARLVRFDKRGTGLSDRPPGVATLEERMEDARAVLDAAGLQRAAIFGWSEGGPMSVLFAATYPERTNALILYGTRARFVRAPDYPWGTPPEEQEAASQRLEAAWGRTVMTHLAGSGDDRFRAWLLRYQQAAASPAAAVALQQANWQIDVRDILSTVHVPTLVLSRRDDPVGPGPAGRHLAERIPGARFVELEGSDHMMWLGNVEALVGEIEEFLTGTRAAHPMDRVLANILLMDVEQSTEQLIRRGDAAWRDALDQLHGIADRRIATFRGRGVDMTGDQIMAAFEGPIRAIRCAEAIQRDAEGVGLRLRAGVHTGEVEQSGDDLRGIAVHIAARIAALAKGNEILVSSTVRDIVAGSGLSFADRGEHLLKGVPGRRRVFSVASRS